MVKSWLTVSFLPFYNSLLSVLGKIENKDDAGTNGHISALTVHAKFRKVGMAQQLINDLEDVCEKFVFVRCVVINFSSECKFVDLFVRSRNINAVRLYTMTGYLLYQRLINYYCDSENDEIDCYGYLPT